MSAQRQPRRPTPPGQRAQAEQNARITEHEVEDIEARSAPRSPVIYEIVRRLGDEEMARPFTSLWWSGIAAGMSISFSLLAQAILQMHLPDAPWRPLVASTGYTVGFIMAILSRQQLFTENTITGLLPLMADWSIENLWKLGRMWATVLAANLVGTLVAALFCSWNPILAPDLHRAMLTISRQLLTHGWASMFFGGITAGFLIAAMVWMIPMADAAQFHVIALMTYLIAAGGFTHIIAGSMEGFVLVLHGDAGVWWLASGFATPVLIGNIIGGTALFGLIAYAQVMKEI